MQGLIVREMLANERSMVLSNWKLELWDQRGARGWSSKLEERDFWCLVNHVLDRITLPSSLVFVGCHKNDLETPMCWAAVRRVRGLQAHEIVYLYARKSVRKDPELAAQLQGALLHEIAATHPLAVERRPFNAFLELRR